MVKYMPALESYLHYRVIDVSSIKELVERWYAPERHRPKHSVHAHRVMEDIQQSIEELKFYRASIFNHPTSNPV